MEELYYKLDKLEDEARRFTESKVEPLDYCTLMDNGDNTQMSYLKIIEEAEILESLASLYQNKDLKLRAQNVKSFINYNLAIRQEKVLDRNEKIKIIEKKAARIGNINQIISESVTKQGYDVNTLDILIEEAEENIFQANEELDQYSRYIKRRLNIMRSIFLLASVFIVLLVIKAFI